MRMNLQNIVRGKLKRSYRVLLYGPEGVGKTTWASEAPSPIYLGAEDGTSQLDIARFPEPERWEDVFAAVEQLLTSNHDYQTLVLDTLDWLEPLCWRWVCENASDDKGAKHDSIDEYGWGRGYNAALDQWRKLVAALDKLRSTKGINIILLAHTQIRNYKNPMGPDYDRYELKLNGKAAGLLREWTDAVLFAQYETYTQEQNKRTKGIDSGARVVHTERRAGFEAKNRLGLPAKLALSYGEFHAAMSSGLDPGTLVAAVQAAAEGLANGDREQVADYLKKAGNDPEKLSKLLNRVKAKINIKQEKEHD